jgi:hypothetical protein
MQISELLAPDNESARLCKMSGEVNELVVERADQPC